MQQRLQVPQEVLPMAWERIYPRPGGQKSSTLLSAKGCFFWRSGGYISTFAEKVKDTPPYKIISFWFVFIGAIQQLKQKKIETCPGFEVISVTGSVWCLHMPDGSLGWKVWYLMVGRFAL